MSIDHEEARKQCTELINAFAYFVDHREFDNAASLFTEDAVFQRPEGTFSGRAEIAALLNKRPANVITRHLLGTPHFVAVNGNEAKVVTPLTLYQTAHEGEGIPVVTNPVGIAEFQDTLINTNDGWRIANRRGVPVLMFQT